MTIETKYNIKDKVWFYHEGKAVERTIRDINVEINKEKSILEKYYFLI